MRTDPVVVIGAGIGGLVAALELARSGVEVVVLEQAATPGGKLREVTIGDVRLDAGPTVFTMRWVFDEIFAAAGSSLEQHLDLRPLHTLARHAWADGARLDLHADVARTADAIGTFAGASASHGFRRFAADAGRIYRTLEQPFLRAARPSPGSLVRHAGIRGLPDLWRIRPFARLWPVLGEYFRDPRLQQLFGRYATYCGSSPFEAPATLMLIAHVEQAGVWRIEQGMHRLATALAALAAGHGATLRFGTEATQVLLDHGRAAGVRLANGECIRAAAVIANADAAAIADGCLGAAVARSVQTRPPATRSLSAMTWNLVAGVGGFPLLHHTVFFSRDSAAEFAGLRSGSSVAHEPTVYVCAFDRHEEARVASTAAERLFCLVNAPPRGDQRRFDAEEIQSCQARMIRQLSRCGLRLQLESARSVVTTPADFQRLFPGTGGALYGAATHGWRASFRRPGARTRLPGLYLAGGSVHPGAGLPMAALSGCHAAASLMLDRASTSKSFPVATPGGTSTASAMTSATD